MAMPRRCLLYDYQRSTIDSEASAWGEAIDPGRHRLRVDVKAVTLHGFSVQSTTDGWEARVILDI